MALHKIRKGLTLPITGEPEQAVEDAPAPSRVAILGGDYVGMKPTMHVGPGDMVRRGQLVFDDKKTEGVRYTAPAGGTVVAVNRGERRRFLSLVIELDDDEKAGRAESVPFESFRGTEVASLDRDAVKELLVESGSWPAIRRRPFSRVAFPEETPHSIFVTAVDSNPLAPAVEVALEGKGEDFRRGVEVLAKLTEGKVFVCRAPGSAVPVPEGAGTGGGTVEAHEFAGPHPAGTVGLHIHTLDPVDRAKVVWHVGYQDTAAIGHLFRTGKLSVERVVSLAGPAVSRPRLLRTRLGASTDELTRDQLVSSTNGSGVRVVSGSVLSGVAAQGEELGFLGRFHNQVSALEEDRRREFLGWLSPGAGKFSLTRLFASKLVPGKKFPLTTTTHGSPRAIVPIGLFERVVPLDIQPTFLLKALVMGDVESAEQLGCLELDEEDLALCTFVCPGKNEYGPSLREVLTTIEKEG